MSRQGMGGFFDGEICWLIEEPEDPPAFQTLLELLRDDVPGACVAEHVPGAHTVFSAMGEMPSLQRWKRAGLPIVEIGSDAQKLNEQFTHDDE